MTLAAALYAQLSSDANVIALAADRIYPAMAPQPGKDERLEQTIVFALSGRTDDHDIDGVAVKRPRFSVFCMAEVYDEAHELADAVEACLMPDGEPFRGLLGGPVGVQVEHIAIEDSFDDPQPDLGWHVVQQEYEVWVPIN